LSRGNAACSKAYCIQRPAIASSNVWHGHGQAVPATASGWSAGCVLEALKLQFGNAVFAAKSIEYDPNLIFSRIVLPRRPLNVSDDLFGGRLRCPGFLSHLRSLIVYNEPEILLSSPH
jgi:hypothetical protein